MTDRHSPAYQTKVLLGLRQRRTTMARHSTAAAFRARQSQPFSVMKSETTKSRRQRFWSRQPILKSARLGKSSSGSFIRDYCELVWHIGPAAFST